MALINLDTVYQETIRHMKNCDLNNGVELMSYKRNRTIAITRIGNDSFFLTEKGYIEEEIELDMNSLQKHLKKAMKREFPRSRKVRLFKFDNPEQLTRHHQKI